MTAEEFDNIEVGDWLTNKIPAKDYEGNPITLEYDYEVTGKTKTQIHVKEPSMGQTYTILKRNIGSLIGLKKKV